MDPANPSQKAERAPRPFSRALADGFLTPFGGSAGARRFAASGGHWMAPPLTWLRRRVRTSEAALIVFAVLIGVIAGLATLLQSNIAHTVQVWVYGLSGEERLSARPAIAPLRLLALPIGGAVLAGFGMLLRRRKRPPIDVVEANALNGGVIPMRDSLQVSVQTLISNGAGASVGLEAAYAQVGGGIASVAGRWLRLRRADLRILVG
ncbi:chloride channel protein, partial [Sphingomonas bacterium]|uniref:chloride channel protein n=1 Tax=Sphingomonas bacterium TaxID=1895847 RepID=UPI0020C60933